MFTTKKTTCVALGLTVLLAMVVCSSLAFSGNVPGPQAPIDAADVNVTHVENLCMDSGTVGDHLPTSRQVEYFARLV